MVVPNRTGRFGPPSRRPAPQSSTSRARTRAAANARQDRALTRAALEAELVATASHIEELRAHAAALNPDPADLPDQLIAHANITVAGTPAGLSEIRRWYCANGPTHALLDTLASQAAARAVLANQDQDAVSAGVGHYRRSRQALNRHLAAIAASQAS